MVTFIITGHVLSDETGVGLEGLFIKAYDKDLLFDDLLGTAITGPGGAFRVVADPEDFREFFDSRPDIYFKIYGPDQTTLLHSTEKGVRWNAGRNSTFEIRIPVRSTITENPPLLLTGDDGRMRDAFDAGEALSIAVNGLMPKKTYEISVTSENKALFTSSFITDSRGSIPSSVLWPQFGLFDPSGDRRFTYAEALAHWGNRSFTISLHAGKEVIGTSTIRLDSGLRQPLLFTSDAEGRLLNGFETGTHDLHIAMHNLPFTGDVRIYMVPRQHDWNTGDLFTPAAFAGGTPAVREFQLQENQLVTRLAPANELLPGAYDFIVRELRYGYEENDEPRLLASDIVTRRVTGFVLREKFMSGKAVLGGCVNKIDIAGRNVIGQPYFRYSDTFTLGEDIYAAIDPAIVDPGNVSKMCAYYIIPSKTSMQWDMDNSLNHLAALGGNAAVLKTLVMPGCVNHSKVLVWPNAMLPGDYDLVADFGNNTSDPMMFAPNNQYNTPLDAIDGYFNTGFRVVEDPGTMTEFVNTGSFTYQEAEVNALGLVGNVPIQDETGPYFVMPPGLHNINMPLRALVHFPSSVPNGTMASQLSAAQPDYPLVVIIHGNGHVFTSYDFVLKHLAQNGFIAVSIHIEGGTRGLGRANTFFKHLEVLALLFPGKIQNNIGIMGHSRGGEAVIKVARMNQQMGLGHNINAIISLAPSDQYGGETLSGAWSKPYFVLYGSRDGDITGWQPPTAGYPVIQTGFGLYDRADGSNKSMAFVYGATHNGFITNNEMLGGEAAAIIDNTKQKPITLAYMNAFYRMHLRGETAKWEGMFKGEWKPASVTATGARLFVQYQDTTHTEIDHFQSGAGWQSSSSGGMVDDGGTLVPPPDENKLYDIGGATGLDTNSPHDSKGLKIVWDNVADHIDFSIPAMSKNVKAFNAVSIRITQKSGSGSNPANLPQNLRIALKDGGGNERRIRASAFAEIPFPDVRPFPELTKSAMCTVRIPLRSYDVECAGMVKVDLTNVTTLSLYFSEVATGEIEIDNVEFTN